MPEYIPHFREESYTIEDYIVERPIAKSGYDAWGCHWICCEDAMNFTHPDTGDIKFEWISDWREKITVPDFSKIDLSPMQSKAESFTNRSKKMVAYISLNGIFERMHTLMGLENALCACIENPEECEKMFHEIAEHKLRLFKKVYDICQPDILIYHDDMAMQDSPFLPNSFYCKYLFPLYKRIVQAAREIGYKYVIHHSCGKIDRLIPDWLLCGFDGWESVMACNNLKKIKKEYGEHIVFLPGLDTQNILGNPKASRADIEHMVVEWMEVLGGDGTGLMMNSSSVFSLNPENEKICLEFIHRHGHAFMEAKRKK